MSKIEREGKDKKGKSGKGAEGSSLPTILALHGITSSATPPNNQFRMRAKKTAKSLGGRSWLPARWNRAGGHRPPNDAPQRCYFLAECSEEIVFRGPRATLTGGPVGVWFWDAALLPLWRNAPKPRGSSPRPGEDVFLTCEQGGIGIWMESLSVIGSRRR